MPGTHDHRRSDVVFTVAIVGACLLVLGGLVAYGAKKASPSQNAAADATDPGDEASRKAIVMGCTTDMATQFHIHPFLTVVIDGEKRTIPANVGIVDGCMHPLHTHDDTGMVHVEAPVKRDFTLGDFFQVWGQPFDASHILDKTVDAGHEVRLLVNGELSQDYGNLVLKDGDQIMIAYKKK